MAERTYTEQEFRQFAIEVAQEAIALYEKRPHRDAAYTVTEAAKLLGISTRTLIRKNLPKNGAGRISYETLAPLMPRK